MTKAHRRIAGPYLSPVGGSEDATAAAAAAAADDDDIGRDSAAAFGVMPRKALVGGGRHLDLVGNQRTRSFCGRIKQDDDASTVSIR